MSSDQGSKPWSKAAEKRDPFLTKLTPIEMDKYLLAVHEWVLSHKSDIQDWVRGRIPLVMLEFEQTRANRDLLGLSIAMNVLPDGSYPGVSVSANDYRKRIIKTMMDEDLAKAAKSSSAAAVSVTEASVLLEMFPERSAKVRETQRSAFQSDVGAVLGKMLYSWPSKEIKVKLQANAKVMKAFESKDLILFFQELREFSLAGSGNAESNREAAEAHLVALKMKDGNVIEYINDFTAAVRHVRLCKSSFPESKIVDLAFRNLDQKLFCSWYRKFLDKDDQLHRFKTVTIEVAMDHISDYYTTVLRSLDLTSSSDNHNNNSSSNLKAYRSVKSLQSVLDKGTANNPAAIVQVSHSVLTTLLKRKVDVAATASDKKKGKLGAQVATEEKKPCFVFAKGDTCKFGEKCRFAHTKA